MFVRQCIRSFPRFATMSKVRTNPTSLKSSFNNGYMGQFTNPRFYSLSTTGENISGIIDVVSDSEYSKIANLYLDTLSEELEILGEDYPQVDSELTQGVLTLSLPPNGDYVINKQPPNKQIWLSSPITGPKRYDLIGGKWVTLRDNSSLTELLEKEISDALNTDFKFEGLEG